MLIVPESPRSDEEGKEGDEEVTGSAILSGGFVERSMALASVPPHRFESAIHASDLHATLLGLASRPNTSKITDSHRFDEASIDGLDLWEALIPTVSKGAVKTEERNTMVISCHRKYYH